VRFLAIHWPLAFAATATLAFALGLLACLLALPRSLQDPGLAAARVLIPVALLTALGWWRTTGFAQRPTLATIAPFLPFALFPLLPLVFGPGIVVTDPRRLALLCATYLALGFGEEATFRGVVLRALAPGRPWRAAAMSSILFGAMHLVNLAVGANAVNVGFQVLYTTLIGCAFAGAALVTGEIWPLIIVHAAMDFVNAIQRRPGTGSTQAGPDIATGLLNVALFAPFAVYGYWLLRRHLRVDTTR
jgi:membrane protease YdiL (CAAX protease family)